MNFQEKLELYAQLLISHGLNVQQGQVVNITGEIFHVDFIRMLVKAAYKRGARFVNVDYIDPTLSKLRVQESLSDEYLQYVPRHYQVKYEDFIEESGCVLRLVGSVDPESLADLSPKKVNDLHIAIRQGLKKYYTEGIGKSKVQWTVAAVATPQWAQKVFPELNPDEAYDALWDAIFHICRTDKRDCLKIWKLHDKVLHGRAERLTDLKIKPLHFVGPDTDLKVILSPKAVFKGGGSTTPIGIDFEPNIPTEECFTTPDYRYTEGSVRITRPVLLNGKLVKGLQLEFTQGELSRFTADDGQESFAAFIDNDPGAKRIGEVSLVGIDSPIYQSKRVFEEILYDENAACHIALGFAYRFCLEGGTTMSPDELKNIGMNESHVHTDFMISSEHVDVTAMTYSNKEILLIKKGQWQFA